MQSFIKVKTNEQFDAIERFLQTDKRYDYFSDDPLIIIVNHDRKDTKHLEQVCASIFTNGCVLDTY